MASGSLIQLKSAASRKGKSCSEETKFKISNANRGRICGPLSNETKTKLSIALSGKLMSKEQKAKLSIALKGNKNSLGTKWSDEAKAKMSAAQKLRGPRDKNTHCKLGHEFTSENLYYRPDGLGRMCKICIKERKKKYKLKGYYDKEN